MKKPISSTIFMIFLSLSTLGAELPIKFQDIAYVQIGSCETGNLNFNTARFSKIPLNRTREDLEIYLQIIIFIQENGVASFRVQEMGLISCRQTNEGEICGYKPFNDTKKLFITTWTAKNEDEIVVDGIGLITKIREDYPWLGFNLKFSEKFYEEVVRNKDFIGGKIQVNFNHEDRNVSRICAFK